MKRFFRTLALVLGFVWGTAIGAAAQTVTAPTTATFTYADVDLQTVTGFFQEYFLCTMSAGVCTPAAAPFQTGVTIPVASVTGTAAARVISLTVAPESGVLASFPTGSQFVGTLEAIGDPTKGFVGNSARSGVSNSFFAKGGIPAVPGVSVLR